jgi:hypothetical protein
VDNNANLNDLDRELTGFNPEEDVIDLGTYKQEKQRNKTADQNPFIKLASYAILTGIAGLICWGVLALMSPKEKVAEKPVDKPEETELNEVEVSDKSAQLAVRDQLYLLDKQQPVSTELELDSNTDLPPVQDRPLPPPTTAQKIEQPPAPTPVPRRVSAPRTPARIVGTTPARTTPNSSFKTPRTSNTKQQIDPNAKWLTLANFSTTGSNANKRNSGTTNTPSTSLDNSNGASQPPAVNLGNNAQELSPGANGIINRISIGNRPAPPPPLTLKASEIQASVDLPLVWDSTLNADEQQNNSISLILEEPIYNNQGQVAFPEGSTAIAIVQNVNDGNGLVNAYVAEISYQNNRGSLETRSFEPGQLMLRNKNKSALIAKSDRKSNLGGRLLAGVLGSTQNIGKELLKPDSSTETIISGSQTTQITRTGDNNNRTQEIAGSLLDGLTDPFLTEIQANNTRRQSSDDDSIYSLNTGTQVSIVILRPIEVN